jgi:tripartite-type tricarboxylate transporter receptor subunit TctC
MPFDSISGGAAMKSVIRFFVIAVIVFGVTCVGSAQTKYPDKQIQIVIGFSPGGSHDLFWRVVKDDLEKVLGVPLVFPFKTGAAGLLAADAVVNAKKDGYTLLSGASTIKTIIPAVSPKDVRDVDFLAICFSSPLAMMVRNESSFKSVNDVIAHAKKNPPGTLTYTTVGVQAEDYWDFQMIQKKAGISMTLVPNADMSQRTANLLGGQVDLAFGTVATSMPLAKAGRLRMLAVIAPRRLAELPDVPTFAELGFPEANIVLRVGLMGAKNLPQEVITTWHGALKQVLTKPNIIEALKKQQIDVTLETDMAKIIRDNNEIAERIKETFSAGKK